MTEGLTRFNGLSAPEAERELQGCFAHPGWAARVAGNRPYRDLDEVMAAADRAWAELAPADWLAAFAAHPRIGEQGGHAPAASAGEQSRVAGAEATTLAELAAANRRYEERFGRVFLIAAAGRSAEEILAALRERLEHDDATEMDTANAEQRQITRLRLKRLLSG